MPKPKKNLPRQRRNMPFSQANFVIGTKMLGIQKAFRRENLGEISEPVKQQLLQILALEGHCRMTPEEIVRLYKQKQKANNA